MAIHTLNARRLGPFALGMMLAVAGSSSAALAEAPKVLKFADVERIALERFPGASIHQIERDTHRGQLVFEVDLRSSEGVKYDLNVDAHDGKVLSVKVDD